MTTPAHLKPLCLLGICLALSAPAALAQRRPRARKIEPRPTDARKPGAPPAQGAQKPEARQVSETAVLVQWRGTPGINRYRLQVATDEKFEDIVFDQAVEGRQYVVRGLPKGNYFWRIAAAAAETSAAYTQPQRVAVSDSAVTTVEAAPSASTFAPDESAGWRTATGEVARLVPAQLRPGAVVDLVGVGADGRVFAVDGLNGVSLWNVRYGASGSSASSAAPFTPVVLQTKAGAADVVVGVDGGVRALRGDTGREVWRARLGGRAASGVAADLNGDGATEVVVVTDGPERLYVLDGATGRVTAEKGLGAAAVGAPFALTAGEPRGVVLALANNALEIRGADGGVVREEKIEGGVTTAPLLVSRGEMPVLVVGTDKGLAALSFPDLKLMGRIVAEDDSPRGALAAADVDKDGASEIVMVTRKGRVALVSTTDGTVRWHAAGATDASAAAFADLNGDGTLDVLVPGGAAFALGFSGRDGTLLMRVEEGGRPVEASATAAPRSLVVAPTPSGPGLLVGADPARVGLRAVGLPKGAGSAAAN
ncbi:MAG TPA: FG-GAP-like repeat-containing protein [Pyrinomonadaceae bacterium]|nr:FG-GAP-like repeat-containing protein [Pyrinomonadaceae bacterium]